ncbi:MAG: DUF11 domain-containing protein [Sedimentisphaerales bacterium]|nr:DUF11 domain-containing protein [Sedimentisphaerales bacterium]
MRRRLLETGTWRIRSFLPALVTGLILAAGPAQGVVKIGGVVFTDLGVPLGSGLAGVTVTVKNVTDTFQAVTSDHQSVMLRGLWDVDVPAGTYAVTPCMSGKRFEHIVGSASDGRASITIVVPEDPTPQQLSALQSIMFLASDGVGAADPNESTVDAASPVNPGGTSTITVTARDVCGNPIAGVLKTQIVVSAAPAGATVSQPGMDTNASGQTTASISSAGAGEWVVRVTIDGMEIADTATVRFEGPRQLVFTGRPVGPYAAGAEINAIPQVTVKDGIGDTDTSYTGRITIAIGNNPAGGVLSGTKQRNAVAGVADFPGLSINKASDENYTLVATAEGIGGSAESNPFQIIPAAAASLVFIRSPGRTSANEILSPHPQVEIRDSLDNRVTGSADPVTVALVGPGTLGGTTTVNADQGVATFADLTVGPPGAFPNDFQLTATSGSLTSATGDTFTVSADPALTIEKTHDPEPADPNAEVVYTITYGNIGLGNATDTVIVETLPAELAFVSCTDSGAYVAANKTITWTIGALAAGTTEQTVSFTARVPDWRDGGRIVNGNLTIGCVEKEPVTGAPPDVTHIRDEQAPEVSGQIPAANHAFAALDPMIQFHVTDRGGVNFSGGTVKIFIEDDLVYDGSAENPSGQYNSRTRTQAVRGICRRAGDANDYTFTFVPSSRFRYEQQVTVRAEVADAAGNTATRSYSFSMQSRTFGANVKVNSDTGSLVQDNPATGCDIEGNIGIVWDQTTAAGDRDIYGTILPAGGDAFEPSAAIVADPNDQCNPVAMVDTTGAIFVVWQGDDPNHHWDIFICSSNGTTWSAPIKVNGGDPHNSSEQISPALGIRRGTPDTLYVAYEDTRSGNKDIWLASSTDGVAWTQTQITNDPADQTGPIVGVEPNGVVYVIWTDARGAGTTGTDIYGARSDSQPAWANSPFVDEATNQSDPAGAIANRAHLVWVDGDDLLYACRGMSSSPQSIIDDEPDALPILPALAAVTVTDANDRVLACWVDHRDSAARGSDIYFAEAASPFGTNVRVNDDVGAHRQTRPAIGVDDANEPYVVWVDNRNGNDDIYYAGATAFEPYSVEVDVNGVTVPEVANLEVRIPVGALPAGVEASDITIARVSNPPEPPVNGLGIAYSFGPSGAQFDPPVTIRIPLDQSSAGNNVFTVYRYDPAIGWTTEGIDQSTIRKVGAGDNTYLEVSVSHFSIIEASGAYYGGGGGGGGGGCALSPWSNVGPIEFIVPLVVCMVILVTLRVVSHLRRRCGDGRN